MSTIALSHVSRLVGLSPIEKLTAYELAAHHNGDTGYAYPSPDRIAQVSGLSGAQAARAMRSLERMGHIARTPQGWRFTALDKPPSGMPVPVDYWPSEDAIAALHSAFPTHHFDLSEAVHDFIEFARRRDLRIAPDELDAAFTRNVSYLLSLRPAGPVVLRRERSSGKDAGVGAFLARLR